MKIDVSDLTKRKSARKDLDISIDLDGFNYGEEYIKLLSPIKFKGALTFLENLLELQGQLQCILELTCSRCLSKFPMELDIPVQEKLSIQMDTADEDEDIIFLESDILDVTEIMLENIILYLPIKRLCKEDCKGLCQQCGTDLNSSSCNCESDDIDPRLAKLKDFFD